MQCCCKHYVCQYIWPIQCSSHLHVYQLLWLTCVQFDLIGINGGCESNGNEGFPQCKLRRSADCWYVAYDSSSIGSSSSFNFHVCVGKASSCGNRIVITCLLFFLQSLAKPNIVRMDALTSIGLPSQVISIPCADGDSVPTFEIMEISEWFLAICVRTCPKNTGTPPCWSSFGKHLVTTVCCTSSIGVTKMNASLRRTTALDSVIRSFQQSMTFCKTGTLIIPAMEHPAQIATAACGTAIAFLEKGSALCMVSLLPYQWWHQTSQWNGWDQCTKTLLENEWDEQRCPFPWYVLHPTHVVACNWHTVLAGFDCQAHTWHSGLLWCCDHYHPLYVWRVGAAWNPHKYSSSVWKVGADGTFEKGSRNCILHRSNSYVKRLLTWR